MTISCIGLNDPLCAPATPGEITVDEHGDEWQQACSFWVPGLPQPGGSKRGFFIKGLNRVVITDANKKAKSWKDTVAAFASDVWRGRELIDGTISLEIVYTLPRPGAHFRTGKHAGELRADAPKFHTKKPDVLKLTRSTEDALTGIIWRDDSLIADGRIRKVYGDKPGAQITVYVQPNRNGNGELFK